MGLDGVYAWFINGHCSEAWYIKNRNLGCENMIFSAIWAMKEILCTWLCETYFIMMINVSRLSSWLYAVLFVQWACWWIKYQLRLSWGYSHKCHFNIKGIVSVIFLKVFFALKVNIYLQNMSINRHRWDSTKKVTCIFVVFCVQLVSLPASIIMHVPISELHV